jgi:hypothetical protein
MEVFVDFGLFELFALSGLAAVGRAVFHRRATRMGWLAISVAAPLVLVFWSPTEAGRWIATLALATTLVNVAVLLRVNANEITTRATTVRHPVASEASQPR